MTTEELIDQALGSSDPVHELRSLVMRLNTEGVTKDDILARLEHRRQELRTAGRDSDEDAVMDVMDFVNGWCSPHMKLRLNPASAPNGATGKRSSPLSEGAAGQDRASEKSRPES